MQRARVRGWQPPVVPPRDGEIADRMVKTDAPLLLTRTQAASRLGVSPGYIYAVAVRGELAFVELPSRGGRRRGRMMFQPAVLEEFIKRNTKDRRS